VLRPLAALAATLALLAGAEAAAGTGPSPPPAPVDVCAPVTTSGFTNDINRVGLIDLYFFSAQGAPVTFYECVHGRPRLLGVRSMTVNGVLTPFYGATQWRCGLQSRYFAATATLPDGTFDRGTTSLRTPSCAGRFRLQVSRRVAVGARATVRVVDTWGIGGIHTRLCFISPAGARACQALAFPAAVNGAVRRFHPRTPGAWVIELQVRQYRVRAELPVGASSAPAPSPLPTVLATGDSTMGGVDSFLADDLGTRANVVSDVIPGFAISLANGWAAIAQSQVRKLHPRVTVMSLGANEGFPMTVDGVAQGCCGAGWTAEYARRVRRIMEIYLQHGHGRVIYLTIAAPREATHIPATDAVNTAILAAAQGLRGVQVVRADLLFSPHGYQDAISYDGRTVYVREPDGVHLNIAGTAIEAQQAVALLRGPI
jgi:lysophospholipase L1-like esterase